MKGIQSVCGCGLAFVYLTMHSVSPSPQFPHEDVRRAAFVAMGQFCRAQHKVWQENPTEANHQGNSLDLYLIRALAL